VLLLILGVYGDYLYLNTTSIDGPAWVQLKFGNVPEKHRKTCFIGVFSPPVTAEEVKAIPAMDYPATPPWTATAALKFITCEKADSKFEATGNGAKNFYIQNMREDVMFWLFYGGTHAPKPIAKSPVITMKNPEVPTQGHIARTHSITEMRVQWNSRSTTPSSVRWGTSPSSLTKSVSSTQTTYKRGDLCGLPGNGQGWRDPGIFHTATLTGLPNTGKIYYQFGNDLHGWSSVRNFNSLKAPNPHQPMVISVVADMGASEPDHCSYHWAEPDAYQTIGHVRRLLNGTDLVLHVGDIAYATGYQGKWDLFMSTIDDVASYVPYMTSYGNHERDWPGTGVHFDSKDSGGECGIPTMHRFMLPDPAGSAGTKGGWYSFDQGSVHFIQINTEMPLAAGTEQYKWIESDLQSVDRKVTPWVIFSGHRPMYSANFFVPHFEPIEPLMMKHQVDLVLWGHVHYASATCPVYQKKCVKASVAGGYDAPIHTIIGNGGQSLSPVPEKVTEWTKFIKSEWGYSRIHIHNATHLKMFFHDNKDNKIHYSITIERAYPRI